MKKLNKNETKLEKEIKLAEEKEIIFLDVPAEHNLYTRGAKYVKNKVIVLDINRSGMVSSGGDNQMAMAVKGLSTLSSAGKSSKGTLYKTTTLRNKFSSSNPVLDKVMRKNIDGPQTFFIEKEREDENLLNATKSESDFAPDNNLKDTYYQSNFKNTNKSEFKIRHSRYSVNSSSSNYSANTIYKVLNKRKNEFISTIKKHSNNPDQPEDLLTQKRNFFKSNAMTHYMEKKGDEVPYVFPIAWIHQNNYNNYSEKNRYEKITELFLKLRYFIERNEENEKEYIKEFMMKHGIYDSEYYGIDRLDNFMNFLNSKLKINPAKTIKQIIIDATNFKGEILDEGKQMNKTHMSYKAKKIMQYSMDSIRKSPNRRRKKQEDDPHNINYYSSKPQPILQGKKFNLDLNNPKSIIEGLEEEFLHLKSGFGGMSMKLNESALSNNNVPISYNFKGASHCTLNSNGETHTDNRYTAQPKDKFNKTVTSKSLRLPKLSAEFDIDQIKKKNKLLEYIVLQRSKSKYQLLQDMKKFKISEIN